MSCFVCSDRHIATIAAAINENHFTQREAGRLADAAEQLGCAPMTVAEILKTANLAAFEQRYATTQPVTDGNVRVSETAQKNLPPLQIIKLAQCLKYQLCEFESDDESGAAKLCRAVCKVLSLLIDGELSRLTDKMAWSI